MSVILNSAGYPKSIGGLSADAALRSALKAKGLNYVGIRGNPHSRVLVLGEAPGEREDAKGLPFIGPSGYLLDAMLRDGGFRDGEVWFSNPYKTRPPDNKMDRLHELGIPLKLFLDQFWEEIEHYKPTIIIACGKTPTQLLCPFTKPTRNKKEDSKEDGFGHWRGSLLTSPFLSYPHYIIPMYHPAFVLRQYSEREICIFILTRAFEEYKYYQQTKALQPLPIRSITTTPSFDTAYSFLQRCITSSNPISVDIELLRRKVPYTVSFAISPMEAISLSFWNYQPAELSQLWRKMDEIFRTKYQIGQNYTTFDAHWLRALGFSVNLSLVHDTLIRHHILWPGLRHKLEFQTMQYTREPYYKEEGHSWHPKKGLDILMKYNCKDTLVTYEIYNAQETEFTERS
jgi:uracil-DNA glycosylase family 4